MTNPQVVTFPNGNTYSADGSTPKDMLDGGHTEHFMPMINDVVALAGGIATTAKKVASDAEVVKSAIPASKLAVESATAAARSSLDAASSADIAVDAAQQALSAIATGVITDNHVSEFTTFSSSEIEKRLNIFGLDLSVADQRISVLEDENSSLNRFKELQVVSSDFIVIHPGLYGLDSRDNDLIIELPTSPLSDFEVHFMDIFNKHDRHPVKILSEHNIMGSKTPFLLDVAGAFTKLRFIAELSDWRLV